MLTVIGCGAENRNEQNTKKPVFIHPCNVYCRKYHQKQREPDRLISGIRGHVPVNKDNKQHEIKGQTDNIADSGRCNGLIPGVKIYQII